MERDSADRLTVTLPSPRSAAESAAVYRRRRGERPRDRWLRILALAGALMVHLVFLFGAIMGPAYELEEPNDETAPLVVRLIETPKEEPPPPPPVRGTPPKQVGPVHKGNANNAPHTARQSSSSTRTNSELSPVPVPAMQTPVVTDLPKAAAPKPEVAAAPVPPVTLPKPAPAEQLQPVPVAPEPPQVALEAPAVEKPVPPTFQPEPVRKPQTEGNQPMPPPASLAIPELPAQSAPVVTPPTVAMEQAEPVQTRPSIAPVPRPEAPASPAEPELQAVPMPAQAAPTVNLQPQATTVAPIVPQERPAIASPSIRVAEEPQLEAVPLPPNPQPTIEHPQAPRLDVVAPKAVALDNQPSIERPQLSQTPAEATPTQSEATSSASQAASQSASSTQASAASNTPSPSSSSESGPSSAPNATPQGSASGTPGQPNGVNRSPSVAGGKGLNLSLPPGQGNGTGAGGKASGEQQGAVGTYVQVRPHGNTEIMSHGTPNIGYQATRFEKDWTPEGESSIDTALRHAVEKTTMRHTFNLPRGVRVECVVMPLFPMALFGCGDGNPPPKPVDDVVYDRMKLAPTNPLVPPPAPVSAQPEMATIKLDNAAQCAAARVAGGPLPPGCQADVTTVPTGPARSSSTWVPASDQFH